MSAFDDIVRKISKRNQMKRNAELIEEFLGELKKRAWKQKRLVIPGFAVFTVKRHKAKRIASPTDQSVFFDVPPAQVMKVVALKCWRRR